MTDRGFHDYAKCVAFQSNFLVSYTVFQVVRIL